MKRTEYRRSAIALMMAAGTVLVLFGNGVQAHGKSDLSRQAESCFWTWGGGYSEYIRCGYGKAEVHFSNTYSSDLDTDTHCAYARRYIAATDRYVEVKSCGDTRRLYSRADGYDGFASCITGHWFCFWD